MPERIIQSIIAQVILDPVMGSGPTAIGAQKQGRTYVGIELSETYPVMAEKRIQETEYIGKRSTDAG